MNFVDMELEIMEYWEKINLLKISLEYRKDCKEFVFLEGPPTANGLPGAHHVLARAIKDIFCRYKNLVGFKVPRKAGWDCHGLPVELEVEKELKFKIKNDIISFGIKKFNDLCKENVFKYVKDWDKMTKRMAFMIDLENPYITMENKYIESVWWSLSQIWKKGLLFQGDMILPVCPRCETSLSSHEVAQGYSKIEEDSIYVKFKAKDFENTYFLVWTTTPWTLPSNIALAVSPTINYVFIKYKDETLILAESRLKIFEDENEYEIIRRIDGADLEGKSYEPILDYFKDEKGFIVVLGDFVSTEEGTGIVHIAPAFGEDDFNVCKEYNLPLIEPIHENGYFDDSIQELKDMWFKDADNIILERLKKENKLFKTELYIHDYPFCWRCKTPLMYYAKKSWFINMLEVKDRLVQLNQKINWIPNFIKNGRFGNFLENVKNWALSRERFWGTPLPIWICDSCGYEECIGSIKELKEKSIKKLNNIDLHKPIIDEVVFKCPKCTGKMHRVPDVIDCWYDSGCAFFAQWHYPFENQDRFKESFPVNFISEAIDQTRGWFYTLHAVSTLLFNEISYENVICLGFVVDDKGEKMSKSKGNIIDPWEVFNNYGADIFRWIYYSMGRYHQNKRLSFNIIEKSMNKFLGTLWNTFIFFKKYAEINQYKCSTFEPIEKRPIIDQWIMSRLYSTCKEVRKNMDAYDAFQSSQLLDLFIDDLSNWYLRLTRNRFDTISITTNKMAFDTLFEVLSNIIVILSPFVPFITEKIYLSLKEFNDELNLPSVHVSLYPEIDESKINMNLEGSFEIIKKIIRKGRALRAMKNISIRQPLKELVIGGTEDYKKSIDIFEDLIKSELNIKKISFFERENLIKQKLKLKIQPNYSVLGKKFKKELKKNIEYLSTLDASKIMDTLNKKNVYKFEYNKKKWEIEPGDLDFEYICDEKYCMNKSEYDIMLLDIEIDEQLLEEGIAREINRRIQAMRKDLNLTPKLDKINVYYDGDKSLINVINKFSDQIKKETSIISFEKGIQNKGIVKEWEISNKKITIEVEKKE
ncbi:MAG: isoleucine--tRNA ligase [Candidatus Helarchaeota archaeon]